MNEVVVAMLLIALTLAAGGIFYQFATSRSGAQIFSLGMVVDARRSVINNGRVVLVYGNATKGEMWIYAYGAVYLSTKFLKDGNPYTFTGAYVCTGYPLSCTALASSNGVYTVPEGKLVKLAFSTSLGRGSYMLLDPNGFVVAVFNL